MATTKQATCEQELGDEGGEGGGGGGGGGGIVRGDGGVGKVHSEESNVE